MNAINGAARLRSRAPAAGSAQAPAASGGNWAHSGADARARATMELQRQKEAAERRAAGVYMPFRFFTKVGESREIIVLDAEPAWFMYEHQLRHPTTGKWDVFEACPKEFEPCPICSGEAKIEGSGKDSYYVLMLSVMDLTPFQRQDKKTSQMIDVPFSRKLLPVKTADQGFFFRNMDRRGTLRGMHLLMARDAKEVSSIGRPELVLGDAENPDFNGWHAEEAIMDAFKSEAVLGDGGKILRQANVDCYAFPYEKLFPKPSGMLLRQRYHVAAVPGSAQANGAEWGSQPQAGAQADAPVGADLDDEIPF